MGNLSTEGREPKGRERMATKRTNIFGDEIIDVKRQNEGKKCVVSCRLDIEERLQDGGKEGKRDI